MGALFAKVSTLTKSFMNTQIFHYNFFAFQIAKLGDEVW
jgi:hypothetical protein